MRNPPAPIDRLVVAQRRLELRWCSWPGDWTSFVERIRTEGNQAETMVLDRWPEKFQTQAVERAGRIAIYQDNMLMELLAKMHALTESTKYNNKGVEVPDNPTRLHSVKYLLDRTLGEPQKSPDSKGETGEALKAMVDRREELRRILKDGVTDTTFTPKDVDDEPALVEEALLAGDDEDPGNEDGTGNRPSGDTPVRHDEGDSEWP